MKGQDTQNYQRIPSSRSRKLYKFQRNLSDGFSESDQEEWFSKKSSSRKTSTNKKLKKFKLDKTKVNALTTFLNKKKSSVTIPEVLIEDFSNKNLKQKNFPKSKLKALRSFMNPQKGKKSLKNAFFDL